MFSIREIVQRFGVTQGTVLSWIHRRELKAINVGQNPRAKRPRWRVSAEALAEFEASRTATPATPPAPRQRRQLPAEVEMVYPI